MIIIEQVKLVFIYKLLYNLSPLFKLFELRVRDWLQLISFAPSCETNTQALEMRSKNEQR